VLGCGFFACISGSDAADAAAIGRITIDRLAAKGYPKPYACALVAAGACTGILIPPSISYIIIGLVLGISASTLFLAAAIPGVLILLSIMFSNAVVNRMKGYENSTAGFNFQYWRKTVYAGRFALAHTLYHFGRHLLGHLYPHGKCGRGGAHRHHHRLFPANVKNR
jgi:C4-dicarboxylate transporter DctM subunit